MSFAHLVGKRVLIPAGTRFTSTHPHVSEGVLKRSITVKVYFVDEIPGTDPLISWTGTGAYWRRCDARVVREV